MPTVTATTSTRFVTSADGRRADAHLEAPS